MIELEIWAAIDLHRGRVVSLRKGKPADSSTWSDNPLSVAGRWEHEGATGLHIVDLDGALGEGSNRQVIEVISQSSRIPVQTGGGIRTVDQAKEFLELGIARVVLGTIAFTQPSVLNDLLFTLGSARVVIAADYRNNMIVTEGWTKETSVNIIEATKALETCGVKTILATAVELDGTALGPDFDVLRRIRALTRMKILASGGIRDLGDIKQLQRIGIDGLIVGRALYEGKLRLENIQQEL